jgi:branched-chain amino acid transport system ATP-binding protein
VTEPVLRVDKLNKRFGAITATRDFSLALEAGEVHALIGPNGAGKTTVLAQLSGELKPDAGTIRLDGRDITTWPVHARARAGLARSFQITALLPDFSAEDNVALAIQAQAGHSFRFWRRARHDPRLREPARQVLQRLGLAEQAAMPAKHLAHGEQRQLEVAMALASRPRLLLLDEPMAGMGPGGSRRMAELLGNLKGTLTLLLVEHDMDAVFALADRISVLVHGAIIATGTPAEIRADPAVRRAYLGDAG